MPRRLRYPPPPRPPRPGTEPTLERPPDDPAMVVGRLLRIHPALVARLRTALEPEGQADFEVVRLLLLFDERVHGRRLSQVALELGVTRERATKIVERAEAERLILRRRTELDRRAVSIGLTHVGRQRLRSLRILLATFVDETWGAAVLDALPPLAMLEDGIAIRPRPWFGARSSRFRRLSDWDEG